MGFWERLMIHGVMYMMMPVTIIPVNTIEKMALTELCIMRA